MACPHCESENHKVQTPGMWSSTHYCRDCKRTFEVMTSQVKWGLGAVLAALGLGSC
jgi:transposase-like protein